MKYLNLLIVLFLTLFSVNSFAYTPPDAPPNGTYILDKSNKLSLSEISQLNNKIENLNKTTKNEYGVLLLASMDGESIEDVANATFNHWGVGKKSLDNGILLVISFKERKTRIETGRGVEQDLPDLAASDLLQNVLKPQLKAGKVYDGINDTIDSCSSKIVSRAAEKLKPVSNTDSSDDNFGWFFLVLICGVLGVGFIGVIYVYYNNKREEDNRREKNRLDILAAELYQKYQNSEVSKAAKNNFLAT